MWNRLKTLFGQRSSDLASPADLLWRLFTQRSRTTSGKTVNVDTALHHVPVYACVRILSESVASLPLMTYTRRADGGREKARNHPLYPLLHDMPNTEQTAMEFFEMAMSALALRGNFYAQILRYGNGDIAELIPLHPDRMCIERDKVSKTLIYKYRNESGAETVFLPGEIWHIRGLSCDGVYGLSPIALARDAIGLSMAQEDFASSAMNNGARPSGVLEHPGKLSLEAKEKLESTFAEKYSGAGNAGRAPVLEEGMKWQQLSMSNEDAQFIEQRKYQIAEIARVFRIPLHFLNVLDNATFSNIEHQSIEFVRDTLRPWLVRIEQSIYRDLMSEADRRDIFVEFQVNALLRGDSASRFAAYAQALQNGWLNRDEVREYENLNPIPGGDGELYLVNSATMAIGATTQGPAAARNVDHMKLWAQAQMRQVIESLMPRIRRRQERALSDALKAKKSIEAIRDEHVIYMKQELMPIIMAFDEPAETIDEYIKREIK